MKTLFFILFLLIPTNTTLSQIKSTVGRNINNDSLIINKLEYMTLQKRVTKIENILIDLGAKDSITFQYNGQYKTYGVVRYLGKIWMDRNLGAKRVAENSNDSEAFGDYFQWGRQADGHQLATTDTTSILTKAQQQPNDNKFIVNRPDWNKDRLWSYRWIDKNGKKTKYDVCPDGWRVPTIQEWDLVLAIVKNRFDAINSPLKLPATGFRSLKTKTHILANYNCGYYWTSSFIKEDGYINGISIFITKSSSMSGNDHPARGFTIRCIRDK